MNRHCYHHHHNHNQIHHHAIIIVIISSIIIIIRGRGPGLHAVRGLFTAVSLLVRPYMADFVFRNYYLLSVAYSILSGFVHSFCLIGIDVIHQALMRTKIDVTLRWHVELPVEIVRAITPAQRK